MAKRTQKAGATARFGARYGVSVRRNSASPWQRKARNIFARYANIKKFRENLLYQGSKCDYTFAGGAWEPFTRASDANSRIMRRSVEGATTADMASIAQQAAMDYERSLVESEEE